MHQREKDRLIASLLKNLHLLLNFY